MSQDWYFHCRDDDTIELSCRAEGPGGMIGDIFREVRPGENTPVKGVSYGDLLSAGGGVLKVHDGWFEFVKPPRRAPEPPAKPPLRRKPGK